ncbi:MAG: creatininase family protein [Hyphomicrobiales bacterium]
MQLQLSTWQEVDAYLERSQTIILPIGSTEQHGPTGLMGTDALCPEALAKAVGDETGVMVGPTFAIGMAQHHLGFAGTMTLRPSTIIAMLLDAVNSLTLHGFNKFYFLNGHGGNIATLSAAFSEIYAQTSLNPADSGKTAPRCKQRNWWDGKRFQTLSKELYGASEGGHATCSEISLTNYLFPDQVKEAKLDPETAPYGPIYDAADFRSRFPDGRMGSKPSLCSVADGERIFDAARQDILDDLSSSFSS